MKAQRAASYALLRIVSVVPLPDFHVRVKLTDGTKRVLELRPHLRGPFFKPLLESPELFAQVQVDHGTLSWPGGQDLDPDVLLGTDVARRIASHWVRAMARICEFDGMKIYVYNDDHPPPHIHVFHGSDEALVEILDGSIYRGVLRSPAHKRLKKWLKLRQLEVFQAYTRAQKGQNPGKVSPP